MITVIQRVCWNDKFWKAPSGKTRGNQLWLIFVRNKTW